MRQSTKLIVAGMAALATGAAAVSALAQQGAPPAAGPAAGAAAADANFDPNSTGAPNGGARGGGRAGGGRGGAAGGCGAFKSVEQLPDSRLTLRVCAPNSTTVTMAGDVPQRPAFVKGAGDLWEATTANPVPAGTYRYVFTVDGVQTLDPQATEVADSSTGWKGVLSVTGPAGDFQAYHPNIPHGVVQQIYYDSKSIGVRRRMQIYTPPGYEGSGNKKYPVLYIRHGAGDDDTDWMTVGRLPEILDNLIAAGKAVPMIVVSAADPGNAGQAPARGPAPVATVTPAGATVTAPPVPLPAGARGPAQTFPKATGVGAPVAGDRFGLDLFGDIIPYVESHYRTYTDADHRAMAGLSAGGAATVNNGLPNPQEFHYIGIFSISLNTSGGAAAYEARVSDALKLGAKTYKLVYFACGNADTTITDHGDALMAELDKFNIKFVKNISGGGHTWLNWRDYLNDFAPRIFKGAAKA